MMLRFYRHCRLPLLAAAALTGCGRQPAPVPPHRARAQPSIPAAPNVHPAPLGEAEILQYLRVMREAARRVQHPTAAERQMLARADAITATANRGDTVSGTNDEDTLTRALAFRMQLDLQVAKAHHLDPAQYQALSERIEDESGELYCDPGLAVLDPLLKSHVREVEHLVGIVRNPDPASLSPTRTACAHG